MNLKNGVPNEPGALEIDSETGGNLGGRGPSILVLGDTRSSASTNSHKYGSFSGTSVPGPVFCMPSKGA